MDLSWLWQGLLTSWIFWLLTIGAGFMVGYLKSRGATYLSPIIYGLLTVVLVTFLGIALNVRDKLVTEQKTVTTTENVQDKIRNWADNFRLKIQNIADNAAYFKYVVTMQGGNPITIVRMKERQNYVILRAMVKPSSKEQTMLSKLSKEQFDELFDYLNLEVARQGLSGSKVDRIHKEIILEKRIPITAGLTEDILIGGLTHIDASIIVLQATVTATLRRRGYLKD